MPVSLNALTAAEAECARLFIAYQAWTEKKPRQRPRVAVRRRQRKPTLASVAKQASKAAIAVARYEVRPDGTVVVVTGTPEPSTESNPWLDDLKVTKQ
jgi:hypothetical protein